MTEVTYLLVGAALGGLLVYVWKQGTVNSERHLWEQLKEQYDARLRDVQLTREQIDTTFKAAASTVLQQEANQYREVAEKDLRQVKTETTGEIDRKSVV